MTNKYTLMYGRNFITLLCNKITLMY